MRNFRAWLLRLVGVFRKEQSEQELAEEMRSHLQMHIDDNLRSGMSIEQARRDAQIKLGGVEATKELYRERRGLPLLETFLQDVRFGFRVLRKNPGLTTVAVLTLALGIGANTAIFSVVNAVLLRPLPYKNSARMIAVHTKTAMFPQFELAPSWPAFQAIRDGAGALESAAAYWTTERTLTGQGEPAVLHVAGTSGDFFQQFGAEAEKGRLLTEDHQKPGENLGAVISDRLWRTRLAADPAILGRTLILDKQICTVVGVAPKNFRYPRQTDLWVPLSLTPDIEQNQTFFRFQTIGTLRKGETQERLQAQLAIIAQEFPKLAPQLGKNFELIAKPLLENTVGHARETYFALLGATTFVLLIACANLTSLLLARGWGRHREMAMRAALGASSGRLQRQCLVESCLLALLGGTAGIGVAALGVQAFRAMAPVGTPRLDEITTDWTLLWFALGSSLVAGLVFGLLPSRHASRIAPIQILKEGGAGSFGSSFKIGNALVVLEVALAFVLLAGSTLMLQTLAHLLRQNPGFPTNRLLTFDLPQSPMPAQGNQDALVDRQNQQLKEIAGQVRGLPGVIEVAAADHGLLSGMRYVHSGLQLEDAPSGKEPLEQDVMERYVSPSYFRILGIPLVRGREFDERDARNAPKVIIVNESMARKYWGTLDVLGKRIRISRSGQGPQEWNEIVGVAADVRDLDIQSKAEPEFFQALSQQGVRSYHLFVRTERDPDALATVISRQIWAKYPDQPVTHVATLRRTISDSIGDQRLYTVLLGTFAAIGLFLALLGVYGVISYSVTRRTQEIGVRVALGAGAADVLRMVMGQGLALIATGAVIGLAAALAMTRLISGELYGVKPNDPATLFAAVLLILFVGGMACWTPARRAMRVDPMVALRYE
jgi:putative ABC transport system permease protein